MGERTDHVESAVLVLAELASDAVGRNTNAYDVVGRGADWQWEGVRHLGCFVPPEFRDPVSQSRGTWVGQWWPDVTRQRLTSKAKASRLAGLDLLRSQDPILTAGWFWLAGTVTIDGDDVAVCMPLLRSSVTIGRHGLFANVVTPVGDVGSPLAALGADPDEVWPLIERPELGGGNLTPTTTATEFKRMTALTAWARRAASTVGLTIEEWAPPKTDPRRRRRRPGLAAIPGVGVYVEPRARSVGRGRLLLEWLGRGGLDDTAFGHLYAPRAGSPGPAKGAEADAVAPMTVGDSSPTAAYRAVGDYAEVPWAPGLYPTRPLGADQADVVVAARRSPILALTGPPGTGKTHTLCEVALDAIANRQSVLIGANSEHAVEVMARHLADGAGPAPILFGGSDLGADLSEQMLDLVVRTSAGGVGRAREAMEQARRAYLDQWRAVAELLGVEYRIGSGDDDLSRRIDLDQRLAAFPGGADGLALADRELAALRNRSWLTAWWGRRRLGSRFRPYRADELSAVVPDLLLHQRSRAALVAGGVEVGDSIGELFRLEAAYLAANAAWLTQLGLDRMVDNVAGRQVLAQVSTATRAGRSRRRELLSTIDGAQLADAAPLWLGTVGDIDEVLPPNVAMFDLVILDEASQMDQVASAGALLRARRAVVCGDPHQLRHLSFVSDAAVDRANDAHPTPARIDVRRDSIFDQALGVGEAHQLQVHYRSWPHLIDFSARRFYRCRLQSATRSPQTDSSDLIDVRLVTPPAVARDDGDGDGSGKGPATESSSGSGSGSGARRRVNRAEIDEVMRQIRIASGVRFRSVGVVTPFRDQADAIVEEVLSTYDADWIERRGLKVGTVHAFQGAEFDLVIASWVLGPDDGARSWGFVNDPNLFNVMVTRARRHLIVVTSHPDPPGLAGDYVRYAEPPDPTDPGASSNRWIERVADALRDAGRDPDVDYPVANFTVDIALRDTDEPTAIICAPHPGGADVHLRRELKLRRMGWRVIDTFPSRWSEDLGRLAVEFGTD